VDKGFFDQRHGKFLTLCRLCPENS
jgi:hypothetical protein